MRRVEEIFDGEPDHRVGVVDARESRGRRVGPQDVLAVVNQDAVGSQLDEPAVPAGGSCVGLDRRHGRRGSRR